MTEGSTDAMQAVSCGSGGGGGTGGTRSTKRARSADLYDDASHSDAENGDPRCAGASPAERKRELERSRRNLVNVRFAELEEELGRVPGAPARVSRRIDKEAVLKEAAQRLASQQRELKLAAERIATMTSEIETLRSEKMELRSDKAYLRSELDTARNEKKRLRSDNIELWQALRKGAMKGSLADDVAKIPASMLLRHAPVAGAIPHQHAQAQTQCMSQPMSSRSIPSPKLEMRATKAPTSRDVRPASHVFQPLPIDQRAAMPACSSVEAKSSRAQTRPASHVDAMNAHHHELPLDAASAAAQHAHRFAAAQQHQHSPGTPGERHMPPNFATGAERSFFEDAYLILQSGDELAELISNMTPEGGPMPGHADPHQESLASLQGVSKDMATHHAMQNHQTNGMVSRSRSSEMPVSTSAFRSDLLQSHARRSAIANSMSNGDENEEIFTDVAPCV